MKYNKGKYSKKNKVFLKILIRIFIVVIFIFFSYNLYHYINEAFNKSIYNKIENDIKHTENNISKNINKVKYLKSINQDVIGWIQIDNTSINYPLLQTSDNEYYLKHDYRKKKNKYGSIFINTKSNILDNYSNIIIYGHNMKDAQMFNSLLKYEDRNYYDKHQTIKIATEKEECSYSIVSVFKSRIFYQDEKDVFRYYNYTYFDNERTYNEFIKETEKNEIYDTKVEARYGEQIITLVTCDYSQDNGRLIVIAKKSS